MWLAVLLGCTNPSATSCDVLVRTGGLIPTEQACKILAENGMYVRAQCYKIGKGESA